MCTHLNIDLDLDVKMRSDRLIDDAFVLRIKNDG